MNDIQITKITVKIGKKEVELTVEQAKELRAELKRLLGSDETIYIPALPEPYHPPYNPYVNPPYIITWCETVPSTAGNSLTNAADKTYYIG